MMIALTLAQELNELKTLKQWVAFKLVKDGKAKKMKKIPINPKTGDYAMSNNPDTWSTFDEALSFAERNNYFKSGIGGIGFEFANGIAGIDLDDVILPDGSLKQFATDIVNEMSSYTEYSVSGKGLHILFKLQSPLPKEIKHRNDKLGIELYDCGRYFTMSGKIFREPKPIEERSDIVRKIYLKYLAQIENQSMLKKTPNNPVDNMTDSELWQKMFDSKNGKDIQALYNGDISAYSNDWSRADLALCNHLAFWCNHDYSRIDSMFRQSGLMRPKWDERRGAQTYGVMTINEAISSTSIYMQNESIVFTPNIDLERIYKQNISLPECNEIMTGLDYITCGKFNNELLHFRSYPVIYSGFKNFDDLQGGFFPGMYVLGATPSLGKTTFLLQVADNIAKSGNFVLYFSFEQSRLELTTKSISRLTAQRDIKNAVSSINIRKGRYFNKLQQENVENAINNYKEFASNISIVELGFNSTVTTITDTVKKIMDVKGVSPVCIIDYVQIVKPDNDRLSARDAVDYVVRALKKFQVDNNLVLFVISSFNRMNYLTPVDYESFKETGLLEYTADCMLGLQLRIMNDKLFDKDKAVKEKRDTIDKAISTIPREITLKNLKNRFGEKGYCCGFLYDCRFDLFLPDTNINFTIDNSQEKSVII